MHEICAGRVFGTHTPHWRIRDPWAVSSDRALSVSVRRLKVEGAVRPAAVVVTGIEAEDVFKLPAADDQQAVEALAADTADPARHVCVRIRRLVGRADELDLL